MDLTAWLEYFENLHPTVIELGLERVKKVAERLDLLPVTLPVITVGGTNGKGSCVALLEAILMAQGYKVGAYTSPHLLHYNERVRINQQIVTDAMLCQAFAMIDKIRGDISLTYFEFGTLAALLLFKQAALDIIILEVGMGGRLDAVNIVDADIAVISTIALDHTEWLGHDRESIAYEKAGIIRTAKPVVCGDVVVPQSLRRQAQIVGANLYCYKEDFNYQGHADGWDWHNKQKAYTHLPLPRIALQNAACILQVITLLPALFSITREAIEAGLKTVQLPGRFQVINSDGITTILDVAHNPAGGTWLAKQLQQQPCDGRTLAVVGMLSDKDRLGTVRPLLKQVDEWYVAGLNVPRGDTGDEFMKQLNYEMTTPLQLYSTVTQAYIAARQAAKKNDRIVVFGSFHTVAEILALNGESYSYGN